MSKLDQKTSVFVVLGSFAFIGLIALYVMEFPYFSNTRNIAALIQKSFLYTTIVVLLMFAIGYLTGVLRKESIRLHVFFMVSLIMMAPLFGSFTNRKLSRARPYSETFDYLGQKGYYIAMLYSKKNQPADTYWIYLRKNGKDYTFRTHGALPQNNSIGSKVRLVMKKGFWGYDYFDGKSWEFF